MNPLNPKKLLLSKWTALQPLHKDKHFLIVEIIEPLDDSNKIEWVDVEAVFSRSIQQISWRELQNEDVWKQGWV